MALLEIILMVLAIIVILVVIYFVFFKKNEKLLVSNVQPSNPGLTVSSDQLPDNNGANFTLALWFYVNDWNINYGVLKPILVQSAQPSPVKIAGTDNAPLKANNDIAIALDPYENDLLIGIKTFKQSTTSTDNLASTDYFTQIPFENDPNYKYEIYRINNIDLQKWVCLIISVDTRTLDIYLHGKLIKTYILPNTYGGSKDNIYLGNTTTTYDGYLAMVRYLPNAINTQQAYNIYREGLSSSALSSFFDKYQLKLQFMEYNNPVGDPLII